MTAELKPRITTEGRTSLQDVIPLSTPYLVFLDPSDICNYHCEFCPSGNPSLLKKVGRVPQLMDWELYIKIIDDLCQMPKPIKVLRMYKDGEPFLNPRFTDMVRYAKGTERFLQIDTTTNGSRLTNRVNRELINVSLDKIFISAPRDYNQKLVDRVGSLFSMSKGIIKIHVKIIEDGITEKDKEVFLADFLDICDEISFEHIAPCWSGHEIDGVNPDVGIYGQPLPKRGPRVCSYIFYSLAINSNGTVSLCFLDWKHSMILGDLKISSFKEIWNGELLKGYHIEHLAKRRSFIQGCNECGQLWYGASDNIDDYAEEILGRIL